MPTLGIGVAGYGFIGKVHTLAHRMIPLMYSPVPAKTRLVGVCTQSEESGRKALDEAGFEFATTNFEELIAREDIHCVHICTPNSTHHRLVSQSIAAGKHVYCDKPLALNSDEAADLYQLSTTSPFVCQMTFNYRFVPATMRARQWIEQGGLGDLLGFRCAYLHAGYVDPARPYTWRMDRAASGGGAIMDLGVHVIDLLRYLVGPGRNVPRAGEVCAVSAHVETVVPYRTDPRTGLRQEVNVDDVALLTCRLEGGATGTIEASRMATGVQDELRIELHGTRGALRFNLMDPNWLYVYDASRPEGELGADRGFTQLECATRYPAPYVLGGAKNTVGWLSFHVESLADFLGNVTACGSGPRRPSASPDFADGLAAQRVVSAAIASGANRGAWTEVNTTLRGAQ